MLYQPTGIEIQIAMAEVCGYKVECDVKRVERAAQLLETLSLSYEVKTWWCKSQQGKQDVEPYALSVGECSSSANDCTCIDRLYNGGQACKHMLAFTMYKFILERQLCHRVLMDCDLDWIDDGLFRFHDFQRDICYVRRTDIPSSLWAFDAPSDMAKFACWLKTSPAEPFVDDLALEVLF